MGFDGFLPAGRPSVIPWYNGAMSYLAALAVFGLLMGAVGLVFARKERRERTQNSR